MATPEDALTLVITDLEDYMNINFIRNALAILREDVVGIQIRSKNNDSSKKPFAFITYKTKMDAIKGFQNFRGCTIPGSFPAKQFNVRPKLLVFPGTKTPGQTLHSLAVYAFTPNVTNADLYTTFNTRYPSVVAATCDRDVNNTNKGTAIVEFKCEFEMLRAAVEMDNFMAIPHCNIRVKIVSPQFTGPAGVKVRNSEADDDDTQEINVYSNDQLNQMYINNSEELYHALEVSKWNPIDHANTILGRRVKVETLQDKINKNKKRVKT